MSTWTDANQRHTAAATARVAALLTGEPTAALDAQLATIADSIGRPPTLVALAEAFGLTAFESDVLALCLGVELDRSVRAALRARGGDEGALPTAGLVLAALPGAHWSALTPESPLRRWELLDVGDHPLVSERVLHVAERVLLHVAGVRYVDPASALEELAPDGPLAASHAAVARSVAAGIAGADAVVQLASRRRLVGRGIAAAAASAVGLRAAVIRADDIPDAARDRRRLARRIERECVLAGLLPVVDALGAQREAQASAALLADELAGALVVLVDAPIELSRRDLHLAATPATPPERLAEWHAALGERADRLDGLTDRAAELFDLDPAAIHAAAAEYAVLAPEAGEADEAAFWDTARRRARPRLDHLAERVGWAATWDQLVLPEAQKATLKEIATQACWRETVLTKWGFGAAAGTGRGISVLFHGPSGTGKTMAASVIATDLGLDLYRIDLSRVVSKYIGETEKHLGTIFDEAEGAGAILLFDEADALFGRRSEVKDSHDRYANLEVSYLLQRMEDYAGLAILTTNQRGALDPAFLRRLRFTVAFAFPDAECRAAIWRGAFPADAPTAGLDPERLARLNVAGGNIRTMALNAAFRAAADGTPIGMGHVLEAAKAEFAKLERQLPEAQVRGWQ